MRGPTTAFGLLGIAGESRSGDANGQYIRVEAGGGAGGTVTFPNSPAAGGDDSVGLLDFPLLGATPRIADSAKTPFRPGQPCERQEQPDLSAGVAEAPSQQALAQTSPADQLAAAFEGAEGLEALGERGRELQSLLEAGKLEQANEVSKDLFDELDKAGQGASR